MKRKQTHAQFHFEYRGKELTFDVSGYVLGYVPARINPVDSSHDAEGGDVEDITLKLNGKEIDVDEAAKKYGFKVSAVEEKIYETWCEQDPDFNED